MRRARPANRAAAAAAAALVGGDRLRGGFGDGGLAGGVGLAVALGTLGAVGHRVPGVGGAKAALADIGQARGGGVAARLGGAG